MFVIVSQQFRPALTGGQLLRHCRFRVQNATHTGPPPAPDELVVLDALELVAPLVEEAELVVPPDEAELVVPPEEVELVISPEEVELVISPEEVELVVAPEDELVTVPLDDDALDACNVPPSPPAPPAA